MHFKLNIERVTHIDYLLMSLLNSYWLILIFNCHTDAFLRHLTYVATPLLLHIMLIILSTPTYWHILPLWMLLWIKHWKSNTHIYFIGAESFKLWLEMANFYSVLRTHALFRHLANIRCCYFVLFLPLATFTHLLRTWENFWRAKNFHQRQMTFTLH
jgi:hypothetical protein